MEPETTKHGPRVDEAMSHDVGSLRRGAPVESRAQEGRLQEDPAVDAGLRSEQAQPAGLGLSEPDASRRADLARHLASATFPARRDELVAAAEDASAPDDLVSQLRRLGPEATYGNVQAVWEGLGGPTEGTHT